MEEIHFFPMSSWFDKINMCFFLWNVTANIYKCSFTFLCYWHDNPVFLCLPSLLDSVAPAEPLLCKFADGGQKKRQTQVKYPQNGRPWTREGEVRPRSVFNDQKESSSVRIKKLTYRMDYSLKISCFHELSDWYFLWNQFLFIFSNQVSIAWKAPLQGHYQLSFPCRSPNSRRCWWQSESWERSSNLKYQSFKTWMSSSSFVETPTSILSSSEQVNAHYLLLIAEFRSCERWYQSCNL